MIAHCFRCEWWAINDDATFVLHASADHLAEAKKGQVSCCLGPVIAADGFTDPPVITVLRSQRKVHIDILAYPEEKESG